MTRYEDQIIRGLAKASKATTATKRHHQLFLLLETVRELISSPEFKLKENYFPIESWILSKELGKMPMEVQLANP
jgi:hypothetical protein